MYRKHFGVDRILISDIVDRKKNYIIGRKKVVMGRKNVVTGRTKVDMDGKKVVMVERKLSWVERRLSRVERKLSWMERKLSWEERKLSWKERKLSWVERKLSWVERKLSRVERQLSWYLRATAQNKFGMPVDSARRSFRYDHALLTPPPVVLPGSARWRPPIISFYIFLVRVSSAFESSVTELFKGFFVFWLASTFGPLIKHGHLSYLIWTIWAISLIGRIWELYKHTVVNASVGDSEKPELQLGLEPTTLHNLVGCSNHWDTGDSVVSKCEMWLGFFPSLQWMQ